MPLTYVIDQDSKIVFSTASGVLTTNEVLIHQSTLKSDSCFDPTFSQLFDASGVTSIVIETASVKKFAAKNLFDPRARRAAVAKSPIAVGLLRMFQAYGEIAKTLNNLRIFDNRDEALIWLTEQ